MPNFNMKSSWFYETIMSHQPSEAIHSLSVERTGTLSSVVHTQHEVHRGGKGNWVCKVGVHVHALLAVRVPALQL